MNAIYLRDALRLRCSPGRIDLIKAEMTLPGREVACIVKASGRFGG
jgi:hypothetical protein